MLGGENNCSQTKRENLNVLCCVIVSGPLQNITKHNHRSDVSSPLPYSTGQKKVTDTTHTQGEGVQGHDIPGFTLRVCLTHRCLSYYFLTWSAFYLFIQNEYRVQIILLQFYSLFGILQCKVINTAPEIILFKKRDFPGGKGALQCRDVGSIPGQGTKIPHAAEKLSPSTSTREPVCRNYRAQAPWNPRTTIREKPACHT